MRRLRHANVRGFITWPVNVSPGIWTQAVRLLSSWSDLGYDTKIDFRTHRKVANAQTQKWAKYTWQTARRPEIEEGDFGLASLLMETMSRKLVGSAVLTKRSRSDQAQVTINWTSKGNETITAESWLILQSLPQPNPLDSLWVKLSHNVPRTDFISPSDSHSLSLFLSLSPLCFETSFMEHI